MLGLIASTQWILLRINYAINEILKYWLKDEYELKILTSLAFHSFPSFASQAMFQYVQLFHRSTERKGSFKLRIYLYSLLATSAVLECLLKSQCQHVAQFKFPGGTTPYYSYFGAAVICVYALFTQEGLNPSTFVALVI